MNMEMVRSVVRGLMMGMNVVRVRSMMMGRCFVENLWLGFVFWGGLFCYGWGQG